MVGACEEIDHDIARHAAIDCFNDLACVIDGCKGMGEIGATIAVRAGR